MPFGSVPTYTEQKAEDSRMRFTTWLVAALELGSLVVLTAVSLMTSSRKAQDIYAQLDGLNSHHRRVEEICGGCVRTS
jgi:hypothetical protein